MMHLFQLRIAAGKQIRDEKKKEKDPMKGMTQEDTSTEGIFWNSRPYLFSCAGTNTLKRLSRSVLYNVLRSFKE